MTDDNKTTHTLATQEQLENLVSHEFARRTVSKDSEETVPCKLDDEATLIAILEQLKQIPLDNQDQRTRKQIRQLESADLSKAVIEKSEHFNFFKFAKKREMSGRFEFFARECTLKESGFKNKEEYEQTLSKLNTGELEVHDLPLTQLNMGSLIQLVITEDPKKKFDEVLLWRVLRDTHQRTTNMNIVYLPEEDFKNSVLKDLDQYQHRLNIPKSGISNVPKPDNSIEP